MKKNIEIFLLALFFSVISFVIFISINIVCSLSYFTIILFLFHPFAYIFFGFFLKCEFDFWGKLLLRTGVLNLIIILLIAIHFYFNPISIS